MDLKDKRLLLELFNDSRASFTTIAEQIGVSKEVCRYNYEKMLESKVIKKIIPIIDFYRLGFNIYRLHIKLEPISNEEKLAFIEKIKKIKKLVWVDEIYGKWDLLIHLYLENNSEFDIIYNQLLNENGSIIEDKVMTIITNITYYSPNYLIEDSKRYEIEIGGEYKKQDIDESKKIIINSFFEDARVPIVNIASKLNLTLNAVKYQIKGLKEEGIIKGFIPIIDYEKYGYEHFNVKIELLKPNQKEEFIRAIKTNPNVTLLIESLGKYDIEFDCEYQKVQILLQLITEYKKKFKIKDYEITFDNHEVMIESYHKNLFI